MRLRVWGIPCPHHAQTEDESTTWAYRAWFWLYSHNQRVRHRIGLHQKPITYSIAPRCDWCGHRSPKQRAVADANRRALDADPTRGGDHNPQRGQP